MTTRTTDTTLEIEGEFVRRLSGGGVGEGWYENWIPGHRAAQGDDCRDHGCAYCAYWREYHAAHVEQVLRESFARDEEAAALATQENT